MEKQKIEDETKKSNESENLEDINEENIDGTKSDNNDQNEELDEENLNETAEDKQWR